MIWLLEELGVAYDIRPVSIFRPMTGDGLPDPANPHPDKRVPAIEHDGEIVAESVAITLYLVECFPEANLGPAVGGHQRGDYLTWLAWYAAELEPAMFASMTGELAGSPQKKKNFDTAMVRLTAALSKNPYVMGGNFSAADFLISSALAFGRQAFPPSALFDSYIERCQSRPAAAKAATLDDASGPQPGA
jgi:glutathione S-transferase